MAVHPGHAGKADADDLSGCIDSDPQLRTAPETLSGRLFSDGPDLRYTYDALDRLTSANGISLGYDKEGRIEASDHDGTVFGGGHDAGGRLATTTYNNGAFTVSYSYEPATGLLSRVTDALTGTRIEFAYDNDRRLVGINRSNGINAAFTYDNAARLTRIQDGAIIDPPIHPRCRRSGNSGGDHPAASNYRLPSSGIGCLYFRCRLPG